MSTTLFYMNLLKLKPSEEISAKSLLIPQYVYSSIENCEKQVISPKSSVIWRSYTFFFFSCHNKTYILRLTNRWAVLTELWTFIATWCISLLKILYFNKLNSSSPLAWKMDTHCWKREFPSYKFVNPVFEDFCFVTSPW